MTQDSKFILAAEVASDLLRWWGLVVAGLTLGLAAGIATYHFMPKTYQARTAILITPSQMPSQYVPSAVTDDMAVRLRALRESVLSRTYLVKIIKDFFGAPSDPREVERLVGVVRNSVTITVHEGGSRGAGTFEIVYEDRVPERTALVANKLAELYIAENSRLRTVQAQSTADTLKQLADEVGAQLAIREREIANYRSGHLSELGDHLQANLQLLNARQSDLEANRRATEAAEERLRFQKIQRDQAMGAASATPGTIISSEQGDPRIARLNSLEREIERLRARYTDEHPNVRSMRAEIEQLRASIRANAQSAPANGTAPANATPVIESPLDAAVHQTEREIARLKTDADRIRAEIAIYQGRVEGTPRADQQLTELSKGYDILLRQYQEYQRNYEQAKGSLRIEEARKGEQFEIMDVAVTPNIPARPNMLKVVGVLALTGLLLVAGPVVATHFLRPRLQSETGLQALAPDVPVLATFEQLDTRPTRLRRMGRVAVNVAATGTGLAVLVIVVLRYAIG